LAEFEQRGVEIRALSCDVADRSALEAALNEVREALGVIGGVVHAAMGISDGLLDRLDPEALDRVLAPKLGGARNLDELTRDDPLDLFLLYSSATTLIGAPGQGGYVAANLAVEALARSRAAAGLPALAVAWGPIADVGYLARDEAAQQQLGRRLGAKALPARQALDALPSLAALGEPVVAYADIQWGALNGALPLLRSAAFDFLRSEADEPDDSDLGDRLRNLPEAEAVDLLTQVLVEEVARILGCGVDRVAPRRPLVQLGMDSLMALELRTGLERRIGIDLPLMALSDNTTLHSLARRTIAGLSQTPVIANPVAAAALAHEAGSLELLTKPTHREAAE
jgi:acyl carrier protein